VHAHHGDHPLFNAEIKDQVSLLCLTWPVLMLFIYVAFLGDALDGVDVQWKCEAADMPKSIKFGRVEVTCEGYDYPDDPFVTHFLPLFSSQVLFFTQLILIGSTGAWWIMWSRIFY
jgi:hypothetical protein